MAVLKNGARYSVDRRGSPAESQATNYGPILKRLREEYLASLDVPSGIFAAKMDYFRRIKELLERRKIRYIVVQAPLNPAVRDLMRETGVLNGFNAFRDRIRALFPAIHDFTDSPLSKTESFFINDPVHFTRAAGATMMRQVLKAHPNAQK